MNSADLTRELQAARPVAGAALRERVRAIASAQPEPRRSLFPRVSPRRLALVAVPAAAVLVAVAAGVTSLVDSGPTRVADGTLTTESATAGDTARGALAPSAKAGTAAPAESFATTAPVPADDRAQRYAAQLTIAVKDNDALSEAAQSALTTVRRLGGHVVAVQYATTETGLATMTLRVPTAKVQDALAALTGLGSIVAQNVQIDDLQGRLDELTSRERALRERIARLSVRIAAPGTDAATKAALVARRDTARAELAQLRAQSTGLETEANLATIDLRLQTEQGSAVPAPPSGFDRALGEAGRILAWEAAAVLFVLVLAGPVLLVALAVWLARRLVSRARPAWR